MATAVRSHIIIWGLVFSVGFVAIGDGMGMGMEPYEEGGWG